MSRCIFLCCFVALGYTQLAQAQQAKVYRVGILVVGTADLPTLQGFREGLAELGYVEGKNLLLDAPIKKTYEEIRPIARSYIENKFDVIATLSGTAALMAKEMTGDIPIVFIGSSDPVGAGLVKSIANPERNITGVASGTDVELRGKRLQVFAEAVPNMKRAMVLYNGRGENPVHARSLAVLQTVALPLKLKLSPEPIKSERDMDKVLSSISKTNTDGLVVLCSSLFRPLFKKIVTVAIQKKLPVLGCDPDHENERGALLYYDSNRRRIGHRAAWYVDRILKGTKPQDLPVESPTYFELIINLKTAKQIGLAIPPNVLARADKVIR